MMPQHANTPELLKPTNTPFQNIGLAFSGGGFRAASFCLGALSYFDRLLWDGVPLLKNVSYISSASGGTITSAMYALATAEGRSFGDYYNDLFQNLEGTGLLDQVMKTLNDDTAWKDHPCKHRNLINAFALTYDQLLFKGRHLADLEQAVPGCHLDEVCFNTTEFYRGLLFRQAVKLKPDSKEDKGFLYGNFIINLDRSTAGHLRLGDVLAASSCFPAGFEPIIFPADFATDQLSANVMRAHLNIEPQELKWEELNLLYDKQDIDNALQQLPRPIVMEDLKKALKDLPVRESFEAGFMDGGIDDNQGIDSIMRANERRMKGETGFPQFDLMLINDVGSHYMDPFHPAEDTNTGGITVFTIFIICVAGILAGIAAIAGSCYTGSRGWSVVLSAIGSVLFLASVAIAGSLLFLKKFIAGKLRNGAGLNLNKNFSRDIVDKLFHFFGGTPLNVIISMLKSRFSSVLTLNNDVFLKRVRQLLYGKFLENGRDSFRMKTNHVYDLAFSNDLNRLGNDPESLTPSTDMQIVAQCAFEMTTTLWFDNIHKKDYNQAALIACGQFTTCYNLLVYVLRMKVPDENGHSYYAGLTPEWQKKTDDLQQQLAADYEQFKGHPFWFYNEAGKKWVTDFEQKDMNEYQFPDSLFKSLRN